MICGALEIYLPPIRRCNVLSDPCLFGCIFYEKVPIETFHISSKTTYKRQQVAIKNICKEKREKMLWQLQICVQISVVSGVVFL